MKEKIKMEDITVFKRNGTIFSVLLLCTMLLPLPLAHFCGYVGIGIWALIAILAIYYAIRVERLKKSFNIQTYKEILAFSEGNHLNEAEKNREYGKRPYQKILLAISAAGLTFLVAITIGLILH